MIPENDTPEKSKEALMTIPIDKCSICGFVYPEDTNDIKVCPVCKPHTTLMQAGPGGALTMICIDVAHLPESAMNQTLGELQVRMESQKGGVTHQVWKFQPPVPP